MTARVALALTLLLAAPTRPVSPPVPPDTSVPTPFADPGVTSAAYFPPGYGPPAYAAEPVAVGWLGVTRAGRPAVLALRPDPDGRVRVAALYRFDARLWRVWFGEFPGPLTRARADALVGQYAGYLASH